MALCQAKLLPVSVVKSWIWNNTVQEKEKKSAERSKEVQTCFYMEEEPVCFMF